MAISYKDMKGQSLLSHQLTCFKARILCQLANLKCSNLSFFWSLVTNLRSDLQNSKRLIQYADSELQKFSWRIFIKLVTREFFLGGCTKGKKLIQSNR